MKAEFDKEIDSLLRQSARRGRAVSGVPPGAAHLDADEQSAYAENGLPAAARAHYAAHLADCDECRRSVTQLALAAGMPAQLEPRETATAHEVAKSMGWRERLGALFAPRALRYAAPALALLLVCAVSFIVLTRKTRDDAASVARHNPAETKRAPEAQTEAHHAPPNYDAAANATPGGASSSSGAAAEPDASASREEVDVNNPRGEVAAPVTVAPLNDEAPPPPPAAPASGSGTSARIVSGLPTPAPTPAAVASDTVTITSDDEAKVRSVESVAELRKLEQRSGNFENRQYENRQRESISGPQRSGNNEQARNARTGNAGDAQNRADEKDRVAATTAAPAPAAATSAKRSTRREMEASESSEGERAKPAETRTVAGRKFRRQGDAWVDTAFNAGRSYTVVRRNSEQFRALVADEPEIRRIAGALGGDVTVVWKGRAYRIR